MASTGRRGKWYGGCGERRGARGPTRGASSSHLLTPAKPQKEFGYGALPLSSVSRELRLPQGAINRLAEAGVRNELSRKSCCDLAVQYNIQCPYSTGNTTPQYVSGVFVTCARNVTDDSITGLLTQGMSGPRGVLKPAKHPLLSLIVC